MEALWVTQPFKSSNDPQRVPAEAASELPCSEASQASPEDLRATLHAHRRHLLLVSVSMETGHVVINDLNLLPGETGVLIEDDLVLLAVLEGSNRGHVQCQ